ncbi:MAG: hypothetical protein AMXMBFR66_27120 [Pseudomonadota bacterium]|nr:N-acetyltransferase [Rubrivivax sp.]NLZ39959.1 GNAT family N-acetyltransferase [Comamonadaceae bacterium]
MPNAEDTARDYHIAVHDDPRAIDARAWNGLLAAQAAPTPFMRHEYLAALHASGSAVPTTGWTPRFVLLARGSTLHAACALYAKAHSYGEYVFDWAWADAHRRLGLAYYPKLLAAVPFTPVAGTRLLARDEAARRALAFTLLRFARDEGLSSAHVLFVDDADARALAQAGWLLRHGVQFHWQARAVAPAGDFAGFLAALQRDKRKKIAQERRRIAEQGIGFTVHEGEAIDAPLWDFFHHCYTLTYRAHHGTPYLTRAFFAQVAASMPRNWLMFVAREGSGGPLAAALVALDPERRSAYGRYWGAVRQVPGLHFEACYYQPLAWCIAKGWIRFEGGAQGEHKMARGLLPVRTTSAHWLRDARLAQAVQRFLAAEDAGVEAYVDELRARTPFRSGEG